MKMSIVIASVVYKYLRKDKSIFKWDRGDATSPPLLLHGKEAKRHQAKWLTLTDPLMFLVTREELDLRIASLLSPLSNTTGVNWQCG